MGALRAIGDWLGLTVPAAEPYQAAATLATAAQLPNVAGDVAQVQDLPPEVGEAFGINTTTSTISRRQAMRVPAFARGRNVICGSIGVLDWFAIKGGERVDDWPLLSQPDLNAIPLHTFGWTVDDLLCKGIAWWHITDRQPEPSDFPRHAEWVSKERVTVEGDVIRLDGKVVPTRDMIRFDGPHEGVLGFGGDVLAGALALEQAVKRYADNPSPNTVLADKRPMEAAVRDLTDDEVTALVDSWKAGNVKDPVRYLNRYVSATPFGWDPSQMDLTNARQQAAVQVARLLSMPSRKVNAPSESSMTYSTTQADRQELIDETLAPFIVAIEQRLSMPDVTPRGWKVRADRDGFTQGTTKDRLENAQTFLAAKLGDRNEARALYLDLPPIPDDPEPPAPAPAPAPPTPEEQS